MSVPSSWSLVLCGVNKASLLLLACLLISACRAPNNFSSTSSIRGGGPPAWGPLAATAHIHVAPEYFQRCDAVPAPPPTITGGAWLLRELAGPRDSCSSSLSALLLCDKPQGLGGPPHNQDFSPRELQAVDGANDARRPSVGLEAEEGTPAETTSDSPPATADAGAAAAAGAPAGSSLADAAGEEASRKRQEAPPAEGAVRARQGPLEPRPKGAHQKGPRSPSLHELDKSPHQQQQQHQLQKQQQQKQKQQQQQQQQEQQEQQARGGGFLSFSSLLASVLSSASVVAATELGDRTFFMCALLAVRYSRRVVFMATCAALFMASAVSAAAGRLLQGAADACWLPGPLRSAIAGGSLMQWVSALFLFCFGLWHLYKACGCNVLQGRGAAVAPHSSRRRLSCSPHSRGPSMKLTPEQSTFSTAQDGGGPSQEGPTSDESEGGAAPDSEGSEERRGTQNAKEGGTPSSDLVSFGEFDQGLEDEVKENLEEAREDVERLQEERSRDTCSMMIAEEHERLVSLHPCAFLSQYTRLGLNPEGRRVFREVFLLILLAEWGDKSMFATISLAAAHNPLGVFIGSCLGHAMVTFVGVLGGLLLQQWLNEHTLNIAAGLLMVAVGVATAAEASA
ncbi:hypothetical protein ACSSS7_002607 [Eimeria intestinalis]